MSSEENIKSIRRLDAADRYLTDERWDVAFDRLVAAIESGEAWKFANRAPEYGEE